MKTNTDQEDTRIAHKLDKQSKDSENNKSTFADCRRAQVTVVGSTTSIDVNKIHYRYDFLLLARSEQRILKKAS